MKKNITEIKILSLILLIFVAIVILLYFLGPGGFDRQYIRMQCGFLKHVDISGYDTIHCSFFETSHILSEVRDYCNSQCLPKGWHNDTIPVVVEQCKSICISSFICNNQNLSSVQLPGVINEDLAFKPACDEIGGIAYPEGLCEVTICN